MERQGIAKLLEAEAKAKDIIEAAKKGEDHSATASGWGVDVFFRRRAVLRPERGGAASPSRGRRS